MFILNKKHAHRESDLNFSAEYNSYDEAFESLIEEIEDTNNYSIEYGGSLKEYKVYDKNTCSYTYDEDLDVVTYHDEPDIQYGVYSAWLGDFHYKIEEQK